MILEASKPLYRLSVAGKQPVAEISIFNQFQTNHATLFQPTVMNSQFSLELSDLEI